MNEEILREGAEKRTGPASTGVSPDFTRPDQEQAQSLAAGGLNTCRRTPGRRTGKSVSLVFWSLSTELFLNPAQLCKKSPESRRWVRPRCL